MKLKSLTNKDRYGNMFSVEFFEPQESVPMMMLIPDMNDGYNGADSDMHPGNPKGTDTVPAWLTPGENVVNAEASRIPGNQEMIDQMNDEGRMIQQAQGGPIPTYESDGGMVYAAEGTTPYEVKRVRPTLQRNNNSMETIIPPSDFDQRNMIQRQIPELNLTMPPVRVGDPPFIDEEKLSDLGMALPKSLNDAVRKADADRYIADDMYNMSTEDLFNRLVNDGMTPAQAAGVIGNFVVETGAYVPNSNKKVASTIDFGTYQGKGGAGRGVAQWGGAAVTQKRADHPKEGPTKIINGYLHHWDDTANRDGKGAYVYDRFLNLKAFAKERDLDWRLPNTQLAFMYQEPEFKKMLKDDDWKNADNEMLSTAVFEDLYEKAGIARLGDRQRAAGQVLEMYNYSGGQIPAYYAQGTDDDESLFEKFKNLFSFDDDEVPLGVSPAPRGVAVPPAITQEPPKPNSDKVYEAEDPTDFSRVEELTLGSPEFRDPFSTTSGGMGTPISDIESDQSEIASINVFDTGNKLNRAIAEQKDAKDSLINAKKSGTITADKIKRLEIANSKIPELKRLNKTALSDKETVNKKLFKERASLKSNADKAIAGGTGGVSTDSTLKDATRIITQTGKDKAQEDPDSFDKVKGWVAENFGYLKDDKLLARMAVQYLGSRALGYDHLVSARYAAKDYMTELDEKLDKKPLGVKKRGGRIYHTKLGVLPTVIGTDDIERVNVKGSLLRLDDSRVAPFVETYDENIHDLMKLTSSFQSNLKNKIDGINQPIESKEDQVPKELASKLAQEATSLFKDERKRFGGLDTERQVELIRQMSLASDDYFKDYQLFMDGETENKPQSLKSYYNDRMMVLNTDAIISFTDIQGTSSKNMAKLDKEISTAALNSFPDNGKAAASKYKQDWSDYKSYWKAYTQLVADGKERANAFIGAGDNKNYNDFMNWVKECKKSNDDALAVFTIVDQANKQ